ncbi:hypothetical protein AVEN_107794-1 [Araneus ventricosus]|uniref:Uncharacterized protein n=1 Tax=Araneus ventricosus TaxID=182803 RepID=A0A4Y2I3S5_ARAVE|nr:hypothetical protein AVEN_107794-1 [Araneus ventricosus]
MYPEVAYPYLETRVRLPFIKNYLYADEKFPDKEPGSRLSDGYNNSGVALLCPSPMAGRTLVRAGVACASCYAPGYRASVNCRGGQSFNFTRMPRKGGFFLFRYIIYQ